MEGLELATWPIQITDEETKAQRGTRWLTLMLQAFPLVSPPEAL